MRIEIVTPAPRGSRVGNRITALRWARILRRLGHRVAVATRHQTDDLSVLVAVHAAKSHDAVIAARARRPDLPVAVLLSGTDLYVDRDRDPRVEASLELADRIIALHPGVPSELPDRLAARTRVILQSASPPPGAAPPLEDRFEVVVVGHLREIKDPLRAAAAARRLPADSRVLVTHIGDALNDAMRRDAVEEQRSNPRYRWLGRRSRLETLRRIASSRVLVLTSREEGGANVISEALVCGVPVIASRMHATIALLGDDYPGIFPFGDTGALAALLDRAERDRAFLDDLTSRCMRLAPRFHPDGEAEAWRAVLAELVARPAGD